MLSPDIQAYLDNLDPEDQEICVALSAAIQTVLHTAESKVWHAHPVWFLDGNPIVGYSKQKKGIRLMFWSGGNFEEEQLSVRGEKFKDASIFYTDKSAIDPEDLKRWLQKSMLIQYDYKNIVKRKGKLIRLDTNL